MSAVLISVTLVAPKPDIFKALGAVSINTDGIQSVETRTGDTVSAGVSLIKYKYTVRNHFETALLYVSEARSAINTAANASTTPA